MIKWRELHTTLISYKSIKSISLPRVVQIHSTSSLHDWGNAGKGNVRYLPNIILGFPEFNAPKDLPPNLWLIFEYWKLKFTYWNHIISLIQNAKSLLFWYLLITHDRIVFCSLSILDMHSTEKSKRDLAPAFWINQNFLFSIPMPRLILLNVWHSGTFSLQQFCEQDNHSLLFKVRYLCYGARDHHSVSEQICWLHIWKFAWFPLIVSLFLMYFPSPGIKFSSFTCMKKCHRKWILPVCATSIKSRGLPRALRELTKFRNLIQISDEIPSLIVSNTNFQQLLFQPANASKNLRKKSRNQISQSKFSF